MGLDRGHGSHGDRHCKGLGKCRFVNCSSILNDFPGVILNAFPVVSVASRASGANAAFMCAYRLRVAGNLRAMVRLAQPPQGPALARPSIQPPQAPSCRHADKRRG
jgi:hypothetical protein